MVLAGVVRRCGWGNEVCILPWHWCGVRKEMAVMELWRKEAFIIKVVRVKHPCQ